MDVIIASAPKRCFASCINAQVTLAPKANCDDVIKLFEANVVLKLEINSAEYAVFLFEMSP